MMNSRHLKFPSLYVCLLLSTACDAQPSSQLVTGVECRANAVPTHASRLALAREYRAKAKARRDPASIAFDRRLSQFGEALHDRTSGATPTVAEYLAAYEATLIGWEREKGVGAGEARRRARGQIAQSLSRPSGLDAVDRQMRKMRDSVLAFPGVSEYLANNSTNAPRDLLLASRGSSTDTVAFFADIEALALAVADTTRVGTATLADAQTEFNLRAPNWTDTTRSRQFTDVHGVFDTLRLFLDDVAFAAWLADTSNLTPVWSVHNSCERPIAASTMASQADACPPCWAVAVAVARVAGAGALAGAVWEIGKGIVTGNGGGTEDIVEAAATGAAGGVAGLGLGVLLMSSYAPYGWAGVGAAIAYYHYSGN
jgi:hypothetical protein